MGADPGGYNMLAMKSTASMTQPQRQATSANFANRLVRTFMTPWFSAA
jgi:hypothetical protein